MEFKEFKTNDKNTKYHLHGLVLFERFVFLLTTCLTNLTNIIFRVAFVVSVSFRDLYFNPEKLRKQRKNSK